uniref:G-protein coupled receptors family 1 profile domain-containing protein n=1 Tax=Electrophorus electricus TaxID=8005 RepID=A0A4W4EP46_ELEEL
LNISISNLLVCVVGTGCLWYGFAILYCMASLISLAMLPHERCRTMMGLAEKDATNYRKVAVAVAFSWSGLCPFLRVELLQSRGPWHRLFSRLDGQTKNIYIICLFIHLCLCSSSLPLTRPIDKLLCVHRHHLSKVSSMNQSEGRQRHHPVLLMVDFVVVCWLSYGVMAQLATFGTSTIIHPVIFIFMSRQVSASAGALHVCRFQRRSQLFMSASVRRACCDDVI